MYVVQQRYVNTRKVRSAISATAGFFLARDRCRA